MLPRDPARPAPLGVQGWITDASAASLLRQAGLDLTALRAQAATRTFRPVPTGITLDLHFRNGVEHLASENVVGVVRGRDPKLNKEYVALSAHWDHHGIGPGDVVEQDFRVAGGRQPSDVDDVLDTDRHTGECGQRIAFADQLVNG